MYAGCAKPYGELMREFEQARPCCASMKEFSFAKLAFGEPVAFELDGRSDLFAFETGRSFFKAFELPPYTRPYRLAVRSYMQGDHIDRAHIFSPHIITFDSEFNVVRSRGQGAFRLVKTYTESWGLPFKHEGTVDFRDEDRDERYLVVLTTDELRSMNSYVDTLRFAPLILPGMVGTIPTGSEIKKVPHSPSGKVKIVFEPLE